MAGRELTLKMLVLQVAGQLRSLASFFNTK